MPKRCYRASPRTCYRASPRPSVSTKAAVLTWLRQQEAKFALEHARPRPPSRKRGRPTPNTSKRKLRKRGSRSPPRRR